MIGGPAPLTQAVVPIGGATTDDDEHLYLRHSHLRRFISYVDELPVQLPVSSDAVKQAEPIRAKPNARVIDGSTKGRAYFD
jgi:hypothetical protein